MTNQPITAIRSFILSSLRRQCARPFVQRTSEFKNLGETPYLYNQQIRSIWNVVSRRRLRRELPFAWDTGHAVSSLSKCPGVKSSTPPALAWIFSTVIHQAVSRCTTAVQIPRINNITKLKHAFCRLRMASPPTRTSQWRRTDANNAGESRAIRLSDFRQ